jgi:hypothetical protein
VVNLLYECWTLSIVWSVCDAENIPEMDISVYLGKDRQNATQMMMAT